MNRQEEKIGKVESQEIFIARSQMGTEVERGDADEVSNRAQKARE